MLEEAEADGTPRARDFLGSRHSPYAVSAAAVPDWIPREDIRRLIWTFG